MKNTEDLLMNTISDQLRPKAAVSYIRVSTKGQAERGGGNDEGFSIPAQREANKKKATSLGAVVVKEFVDRGTSARSANRPKLHEMLEYIAENKERIDYVIVHKVDRLARNRGDDIEITRAIKDAGIKLVSTSESIDESPAGTLLHGIMSSIAEFYSQNLATEVKKGMSQKVKSGGTVGRAPLGYKNLRQVDDNGRRNSTVILDKERAPLVKTAFELYSTGNWTISELADHLADLGLTTAPTACLPSRPIDKGFLHKVLSNPYYKGLVKYQGQYFQGSHPLFVEKQTWQKVQDIMASHVNGERSRTHTHFLKSTVYCGNCGSRLLVQKAKSKSGDRYPYFVCAGRHAKRNDCNQKAVLIDEVEAQIENLYKKISFTPELKSMAERYFKEEIGKIDDEVKSERKRLRLQKEKLEREQHKLLQAHYEDAIPVSLLKEEQERISKQVDVIDSQLESFELEHSQTLLYLNKALSVLENCGETYKSAPDIIKRAFNQAIFKRILVNPYATIEAEFTAPFGIILNNKVSTEDTKERNNNSLTDYLDKFNSGEDEVTTKNTLLIFFKGCFSKTQMVLEVGFEPT